MSEPQEEQMRQALGAHQSDYQTAQETNPGWPPPDERLIASEKPPAPDMHEGDLRYIFGTSSNWIRDAAEAKASPVEYVALPFLAAAGALIGNSRWASPWSEWIEPPILWVMLVGDPSSGKSPAMDAVLRAVNEIDTQFGKEHLQSWRDWEETAEVAKAAAAVWKQQLKASLEEGVDPPQKPKAMMCPDAPTRKRIRITDATIEKVAEIMQQTWRGLLLFRDEVSGWLSSMDRYGGGGDREFWLEAFGGRSFPVDRKSNPQPLIVDHLSICVLGSTQPEKLEHMVLQSADDGLLSRFLIAYPDPIPLSRPTKRPDQNFPLQVLQRLLSLEPNAAQDGSKTPHIIEFEEAAREALHSFRQDCRTWEGEAEGKMKSHIGKLPGLAVRVSLILALLDCATDDFAPDLEVISEQHIARATLLVGSYMKAHMERVLATSSVPKERQAANKIGSIIRREHLLELSTRDIQRRGLAGLRSASEIGPAIEVLLAADWLRAKPQNGKGRPNRQFFVNPRVHNPEVYA